MTKSSYYIGFSLTFGEPLGQADIQSDVPLVEASSGLEQYYIQVNLTFGQPLGQTNIQMSPLVEASIGQEQYYIRSP